MYGQKYLNVIAKVYQPKNLEKRKTFLDCIKNIEMLPDNKNMKYRAKYYLIRNSVRKTGGPGFRFLGSDTSIRFHSPNILHSHTGLVNTIV